MALSGDVKVPGIKKPLPKWGVVGGLAAVGIGIVWYYRSHSASTTAAAAAAPAAGGSYPPDGTTGNPSDPYSTDPATGETYGDEQAASGTPFTTGGESDPFPWDGTYGNSSDPYSQDPATGQTYGDEGGSGDYPSAGTGTTGPPFSSNAQWSSYAITQLQSDGYSGSTASTALGKYLEGQVLDADQQKIVYAAIAAAGPVPVSGSGGYPPALRTKAAGSKGGTTYATNPVAGLKASASGKIITVTWDQADHATSYQVSAKEASGNRSARTYTATGHSHRFTDLTPGTEYTISVLAKPAEKGATAATTTAKTPAAAKKAAAAAPTAPARK